MKLDQIKKLVSEGESDTLEFKSTTKLLPETARSVCAMANHHGGCVLIGVGPDGAIVGQQVSGKTLEDVSRVLQEIKPPIYPSSVGTAPLDEKLSVVVVTVGRGKSRPYTFKGVAYQRVGNTNLTLSDEAVRQMTVETQYLSDRWESQTAKGWTIPDLDSKLIRGVIEKATRKGRLPEEAKNDSIEDILVRFNLLDNGQLSNAAAVLFGDDGRVARKYPQCLIRLGRFRERDRREILDSRQYSGNAFTLLFQAERYLIDTIPIASRFEEDSIFRTDSPLYPRPATREALANAICHRDYAIWGGSLALAVYDDSLEVTSPGPLHFGLTPEMLRERHKSSLWNPDIAHVLYCCGIIEKWGSGTHLMADQAAQAGRLRFEMEADPLDVTVRFVISRGASAPRQQIRLSDLQQEILDLFPLPGSAVASKDIHENLGERHGKRKIQNALSALKSRGILSPDRRGPYAVWHRR